MLCAECGHQLTRRKDGAWNGCPAHPRLLGYWSDVKPLPGDMWLPVTQKRGLTFYPGPNWPWPKKPTNPDA